MSASRLPGADARPVVAFSFEGRRIEAPPAAGSGRGADTGALTGG